MPPDARVQHARELTRRVVTHDQPDVVAQLLERGRLELRVLDNRPPERPRERDDDPDLHEWDDTALVLRRAGSARANSARTKIREGVRFAPAASSR